MGASGGGVEFFWKSSSWGKPLEAGETEFPLGFSAFSFFHQNDLLYNKEDHGIISPRRFV